MSGLLTKPQMSVSFLTHFNPKCDHIVNLNSAQDNSNVSFDAVLKVLNMPFTCCKKCKYLG